MATSYAHIERVFKEGGANWGKAYSHNNRLDGVEYPNMQNQWMNHEMIANPDSLTFKQLAIERLDKVSTVYNPTAKEMQRIRNFSKTARRYNDGGRRLKSDANVAFEAILCYNREKIGEGVNAKYEEIPLDYDMAERERWEQVSLEWAQNYFKNPVTGENNIISATVHYDEMSPHIHLIVTPFDGEKLNGHNWTGGASKMAEFTHSYGDLMNKEFGLAKPKKNSLAKNQAIKKTRAVVSEVVADAERKVTFIEPKEYESIESYKDRWKDHIEEIKYTFSDLSASTWKMQEQYKNKIVELQTKEQDPQLYNERKIESLENTVSYLKNYINNQRNEHDELVHSFSNFVVDVKKANSMEEIQDTIDKLSKDLNLNDSVMNKLLRIEREDDEKENEDDRSKRKFDDMFEYDLDL